jgi:DNA anti-recombination protein RmuC
MIAYTIDYLPNAAQQIFRWNEPGHQEQVSELNSKIQQLQLQLQQERDAHQATRQQLHHEQQAHHQTAAQLEHLAKATTNSPSRSQCDSSDAPTG